MQYKTFTRTVCRTRYGSRKIKRAAAVDTVDQSHEDALTV